MVEPGKVLGGQLASGAQAGYSLRMEPEELKRLGRLEKRVESLSALVRILMDGPGSPRHFPNLSPAERAFLEETIDEIREPLARPPFSRVSPPQGGR